MRFLQEFEKVLKSDNRFLSDDGQLLKPRVQDAVNELDAQLIRNLMNSPILKENFFKNIEGITIFDKERFMWVVNSREFLPDNYTIYRNKIGLSPNNHDLLVSSSEVSLVWPYKDCVLEGGQDKEDQKRVEIFYNETLAPDEIGRLLAAKAFSKATRYTSNGEEKVTEFDEQDNLIIKGNNLLALSSLLEHYEGQVKCIYIDPPYNTGNDGFNYNDKFNHSTWLTFIKNRLLFARRLLADDGVIFVSLDDKEAHYCKVLMDEVFGRENFVADICHKARASVSNDKIISVSHNHLLMFAKNERQVYAKRQKYGITKDTSTFSLKDDRGYYKLVPVDGPGGARKGNPYYEFLGVEGYWRFSKSTMQEMYDDGLIVKQGKSLQQKYYKSKAEGQRQTITTWWDEGLLTSSASSELNKKLELQFNNPKNEALLELVLEFATQSGDLVLDFFLGSGTTAAVAHKMGRRYVGIEQMDYVSSVTIPRLQQVIAGEQGGVSKAQKWEGGGSFVYVELAEQSEKLMRSLQYATTAYEVQKVLDRATEGGLLRPSVLPDQLEAASLEFVQLSLDDQKQAVAELIDKNRLYVNASDVEDINFGLSEADIAFTKSFYRKGE
ncbi:site-specific DNA-methyltransferase [Corynebacterium sp. HS2168-gen11]|uniref:DNA methyltransferase n=1 Tax=Corynebacterium sp. HS2168-gen11 TaxID=2974027 RepID=UPI00216B0DD4|nr:site-specific DNA-methyltransferase [Corynebacterium sp. HS2168-gen11]MCS4536236.1 site-specific DNA-methyltransferase [Corynebacterium sp. HS2168-gen11]